MEKRTFVLYEKVHQMNKIYTKLRHSLYIVYCKTRLIKFFIHHFVRLTIEGGIQSKAA